VRKGTTKGSLIGLNRQDTYAIKGVVPDGRAGQEVPLISIRVRTDDKGYNKTRRQLTTGKRENQVEGEKKNEERERGP